MHGVEPKLEQIRLEPFGGRSSDSGLQPLVTRVFFGPAVSLIDPLSVLIHQLRIKPDEISLRDSTGQSVTSILLQELAMFANGAQLHVIHPDYAADL